MPILRRSLQSLNPLRLSLSQRPHTTASLLQSQHRRLSTTTRLSSADPSHAHEEHYDPPAGWLWGVPPGEKKEPEGWEKIWVWGFFGSLGLGVVAYAFKPDTSIQTWALEEARRRLEAEGILQDPGLIKGDTKAQNTE